MSTHFPYTFFLHKCTSEKQQFPTFPTPESAQLQAILLEHCLLVAGDLAISQMLDVTARQQLHSKLNIELETTDNGIEHDCIALAACIDRSLVCTIKCLCDTNTNNATARFFDIILRAANDAPPNDSGCGGGGWRRTLSTWCSRHLLHDRRRIVLLLRTLCTHDVRLAYQLFDIMLVYGDTANRVSLILQAVVSLNTGDESSSSSSSHLPHRHRVVSYALQRLCSLSVSTRQVSGYIMCASTMFHWRTEIRCKRVPWMVRVCVLSINSFPPSIRIRALLFELCFVRGGVQPGRHGLATTSI